MKSWIFIRSRPNALLRPSLRRRRPRKKVSVSCAVLSVCTSLRPFRRCSSLREPPWPAQPKELQPANSGRRASAILRMIGRRGRGFPGLGEGCRGGERGKLAALRNRRNQVFPLAGPEATFAARPQARQYPSMARMTCPRGTEDLLPAALPAYAHVFSSFAAVMERHGYREIRTPLFEETSLFVRSLGDESDVVEKEMFTIQRGDTNVTFRPEGTAPVVRAYLEHNLDKVRPFQKFWYAGPMFRFERPQAGRSRQFHQVGVEALGSSSTLLDAEVVLLAHRAFQAMGLKNYTVHLNSIGDRQDRDAFREVLRAYMQPLLPQRCDDCKRRFERNVFRMLDCKVSGCQPSNRAAPQFLQHLRPESLARFEQTLALLRRLEVPLQVDPGIVRGFDYYTHLVFEVRCQDLGARSAVCGGGRYDGLIAAMGGPELGAVGFAIGVTPTLLALRSQQHPAVAERETGLPVFIAPVTDDQRELAFLLAERLRTQGLPCDTDYEHKSLKALFKAADKRGIQLMLVLGPEEVAQNVVKVRVLQQQQDLSLPIDDRLAAELQRLLQR